MCLTRNRVLVLVVHGDENGVPIKKFAIELSSQLTNLSLTLFATWHLLLASILSHNLPVWSYQMDGGR